MDIFVLPSLLEGLPIALLEAMASKLPVVASRVGEVPSLVGMENGLLVEPNGVGELKTCLIQLIENLPLARTMGDRGHQLVARYFSVERMAHDYMAIYREVMRRRNKRSLLDLENKSVEEDGVAV
jgi:glycosyltransferase involved in cell wall biosynthesis